MYAAFKALHNLISSPALKPGMRGDGVPLPSLYKTVKCYANPHTCTHARMPSGQRGGGTCKMYGLLGRMTGESSGKKTDRVSVADADYITTTPHFPCLLRTS